MKEKSCYGIEMSSMSRASFFQHFHNTLRRLRNAITLIEYIESWKKTDRRPNPEC